MKFDVIIIGGGAAGISSALWCDDLGLDALLLEAEPELGGQLLWTHNAIENYLGIKAQNGQELRNAFVEQLNKRKFTLNLQAEIADIDLEEKRILLKSGEELFARSIIIATGISRRKLNIAGEKEFQRKGIIKSGKRDGDLAKGKNAVIVGGGDAAFENALILSEIAERVTLIHRSEKFSARPEFIEQVQETSNIKIVISSRLLSIQGTDRLESVEVENIKTNEIYDIPTEVVLIRIGVEPNTDFLRGKIELDKNGYIKIDYICRTNIENVYAIGDVANPIAPTVSTAVGMGATAVKTISSLFIQ